MTFALKLNKSKQISFRIHPKDTGVDFILTLPGITMTLTKKTSKTKSITDSVGKPLPITKINTGSVSRFQPVKYRFLISKISRLLRLNSLSNWLCPIVLLSVLPLLPLSLLQEKVPTFIKDSFMIFTMILGLMGILMKIYVHSLGRVKIHPYLDLEIHQEPPVWQELMKPDMLWEIVGNAHLEPEDTREHAGCSVWYERVPVKRKAKAPYYMKADCPILQLKLMHMTLILIPGIHILIQKTKVGIIEASPSDYTFQTIAYPETDRLPADAKVLHYTWKYVNKDGSKDKRYHNNIQVPICNYGLIQFESDTGLHIMLLTSSTSHKAQSEDHRDL